MIHIHQLQKDAEGRVVLDEKTGIPKRKGVTLCGQTKGASACDTLMQLEIERDKTKDEACMTCVGAFREAQPREMRVF